MFLLKIFKEDIFTEDSFLQRSTLDDAIDLCIEPLHLQEISLFGGDAHDASFAFVGREFSAMIRMMVSEFDEHMDEILYRYLTLPFDLIGCLPLEEVDSSGNFK